MIVKRTVKFNIKKSHTDYKYIQTQLIESKEKYNLLVEFEYIYSLYEIFLY